MKKLLILLAVLAWPLAARAELPAAARAQILAAQPHLERRVADLPAPVRQAFPYGMANPGAPFQVSDAIGPGPALPGARLVWGARVGRYYVLEVERGGIAHYSQVLLFDLSAVPAAASRPLWTARSGPILATFADFQHALRSNALLPGP